MHSVVEDESLCCHEILVLLKLMGGTAFEAGFALVQVVFNELELALRTEKHHFKSQVIPADLPQLPRLDSTNPTRQHRWFHPFPPKFPSPAATIRT